MKLDLLLFLFCIIVIGACTKSEAPVTNSEVINKLIDNSEYKSIDLNTEVADTIFAELFITNEENLNIEDSIFIKRIKSIDAIGNNLLVSMQVAPFLLVFDKNGNFQEAPISTGRGPGELSGLSHVIITDDKIFATDGPNARINVYDFDLNFLFSEVNLEIGYGTNFVNGFNWENRLFYPSTYQSENSITALNFSDSLSIDTTFHPKFIPIGMQPAPVNFYSGTTDFDGNVYVANKGLFYIVKYNGDFLPIIFYEIKDDSMTQYLSDPEPIPTSNTRVGVTDIITHLDFISEDEMLLSTFRTMSILTKNSNGGFDVLSRHVIKDKSDSSLIYLEKFAFDEEYVYLASQFSSDIYRFSIESLR